MVEVLATTSLDDGQTGNRILFEYDGERIASDSIDVQKLLDGNELETSCIGFVNQALLGWLPRHIRECHACGMMQMPDDLDGLEI